MCLGFAQLGVQRPKLCLREVFPVEKSDQDSSPNANMFETVFLKYDGSPKSSARGNLGLTTHFVSGAKGRREA